LLRIGRAFGAGYDALVSKAGRTLILGVGVFRRTIRLLRAARRLAGDAPIAGWCTRVRLRSRSCRVAAVRAGIGRCPRRHGVAAIAVADDADIVGGRTARLRWLLRGQGALLVTRQRLAAVALQKRLALLERGRRRGRAI